MTSPLLTAKEVAARLGISLRTVQRLIKNEIRHVQIGSALRVRERDLAEYLRCANGGKPAWLLTPIEAPRSEGVYFLRSGDFCKIGRAKNIAARLRESTMNPLPMDLLAVDPDPAKEKFYHSRFVRLWQRGEWFRLEGDLINLIFDLRDRHAPPLS